MRKIMYVLIIAILLSLMGCGSAASSSAEPKQAEQKTLQLSDFVKTYEDAGVEVDAKEKPFFALVYAKDGVIFYIDNDPVKIYEYPSSKEIDRAKKDFEFVGTWSFKGLFALETDNEKAKKIFNSVK